MQQEHNNQTTPEPNQTQEQRPRFIDRNSQIFQSQGPNRRERKKKIAGLQVLVRKLVSENNRRRLSLLDLTKNFTPEEVTKLRYGQHPNKELQLLKHKFDIVNKEIENLNDEVAYLSAKRPCPIEPVLHKKEEVKKEEPKGILEMPAVKSTYKEIPTNAGLQSHKGL